MDTAVVGIRKALASEVGALEDVQRRASLVWEEYRGDLEAHPDAIEVPVSDIDAGNVRVATDDLHLLGFSSLTPGRTPDVAELDGLFVDPEFMGRGIGRTLVEDAFARARERGCRRVEVTANPNAIAFYVKMGFVDDGIVQTRFGPGLRMHVDIA